MPSRLTPRVTRTPLSLLRWCLTVLLLTTLVVPALVGAQTSSSIEAVYDARNYMASSSIRWPAFLTVDQAVDYDGGAIVQEHEAGLSMDEWILLLDVDWNTGLVGGSISGSASLGDPVSQLYESCWASHAGDCAGSATFTGTIVEGHAEPRGDDGQWRICFVVEGSIDLDYRMIHFVRPWQQGLADDGSSQEPNERVELTRQAAGSFRQLFIGTLFQPDGDRYTTPYLLLMKKELAAPTAGEDETGPSFGGNGGIFAVTRGDVPSAPPSPSPATGVCAAVEASGSLEAFPGGTATAPDDADEPRDDLTASIAIYPDPPILGKVVTFSPEVQGSGPRESLRYAWHLDGEALGTDQAAQWTATPGEHVVTLQIQSADAPERTAAASLGFVVAAPPPISDTDTAMGASFAMGSLSCADGVTSDDTLTCSASWSRDAESDLGALLVQWYVDGAPASQENSVGQSATFSLEQPAPGEHSIQVLLTDPASDAQAARTTSVSVAPGRNAQVPVSARAAAAVGSAGTVAGWLWLEWRRARRASAMAAQAAQTQEATDAALAKDRQAWYDAQMQQNDVGRERRHEREVAAALREAESDYQQAASHSHQLAREAADLTRQLQKLHADYTRYTAVSDGIIDVADLVIDVGLAASGKPPGWLSNPAGAGAKDWVKGLAKGAARQKLGEMVDGRPSDYRPLDEALSAAGLPPDYARAPMGTAAKRSWDRIGYDLVPRGALKQAYARRLQRVPSGPIQKLGDAAGPVESVVTGVHDAASKAEQAASLRQRIVVVDQQLRRRNRLFADSLAELAEKRSAMERARYATRTPKGASS